MHYISAADDSVVYGTPPRPGPSDGGSPNAQHARHATTAGWHDANTYCSVPDYTTSPVHHGSHGGTKSGRTYASPDA